MSRVMRHEGCVCDGRRVGNKEFLVNCPNCGKLQTTSGKKKFQCCSSMHPIRGNVHAHNKSDARIVLNVNLLSITGINLSNYSLNL